MIDPYDTPDPFTDSDRWERPRDRQAVQPAIIKPIDDPRRPYCLIGWQPCGCMGIASWVEHDTPRSDIRSVEGKIKRRGYRREVHQDIKGMKFECPEHKALRTRMVAEERAKEVDTSK